MSFPKSALFASLSVFALTLATGAAHADEPVPDQPTEVVITGSGYRISKDALMSHVDILTRDQIDQKPAAGLGDLLAYLPGIRSSSFAPGASRPMIRGLDGFRVLVLNNGMGVVDVSALSPDHAVPSSPTEAKRIEVLRGPSALAYGGNAIGGIVNVIDDRIPSQAPAKGYEGTVALQGSSVDQGLQGAFDIKAGKGPWVFTFDAFKHKTSDYSIPVPAETLAFTEAAGEAPDTSTKQHNSFQDMKNVGAGVSYIGDFGFVGLSYKKTDYLYGTAIDSGVSIDLHQTRWDARGAFNLNWAGFNRLDASAGYSDYDHAEIEDGALGTQFLSKGSEFRTALIRDGQGKWSGTVGLSGLKRDFEAIGDEAFVPSTTTKQAGVFSQYRYDDGAWGLEGGARVDDTRLTSAATAYDKDFNTLSASFGGFYRPSDHSFVGLSLTRSERAPSDVELLADGPHAGTSQFIIGDPDFRTEIGYSLELTGHVVIDHDNRFAIDAHVYTSHFDNFIDLRPTGAVDDDLPVFQYVQTDADLYGLEIEANTRLFTLGAQAIALDVSYDYVHGQTSIGPIIRIPPQALTLKLESKGGKWDSYFEVRGVDARKDRLAAFETPTGGYVTANIFTSYKIRPDTSLFAEVRNIGDVEMREATSSTKDAVVDPGRNLRVGLVYNF
ncbi:TonB-dependent receptor [Asticcacaulis sp.]|uniref:TonB-dependent receptor n=1 Tax=Asticcacaulis sp. TaxID=1872648 RepID=UPI002C4731DF|nr:TonB-dependent receptor [Asticcacaulis sp.]HTM80908.1 TonB-dependent receptor [Asticcacaulis sp.]